MSYCRWSSDDFQCDVYVYADVAGGWTTHVAGNRVVFVEPLPEPARPDDFDAWWGRHERVMAMLDDAEREPIGGPHDGETFNDPSPGACAGRLEALRDAGYNVPQDAIDRLRGEASEPDPERKRTP